MFLNSWRIRLGAIGGGIILMVTWMVCGGSMVPGSEPRILIEFGTEPDVFAGLEVEIDGKVAGKLERIGQTTRTAFKVTPGAHTVRVLHPEFGCRPAQVTADIPGMSTMLLLDHDEMPGPDNRPMLTLHP